MRLVSLAVVAGLSLTSASLAADKYDRNKLCKNHKYPHECDLLIESLISKETPGVLNRSGLRLSVKANNGKVIERTSKEDYSLHITACDYYKKQNYLRLCHSHTEGLFSEYVNIDTGEFVRINGYPQFSPSGFRVLFTDSHVGLLYGIEIWRFDSQGLISEHRYTPLAPGNIEWDTGKWVTDGEIILFWGNNPKKVQSRLLLEEKNWVERKI